MTVRTHRSRLTSESGFTILETVLVVGIIAVLGAMTVGVAQNMLNQTKADSGQVAIVRALEVARSRAVAERRNFEVNFVAPNEIQILRREVPGNAKTLISKFYLENGLTFERFTGQPDTPDQFGSASAVTFTGTAPVMFTSDGSLIDDNGDVTNGTVFLGRPREAATARAITFFGVTGFMRSWEWTGKDWIE